MTQLLQNAVYGTALILAVAALRGALKERLLPEARLALWAVCLFRLFTPIAPASALSLWGLFGQAWEKMPVSAPAAPAVPTNPMISTFPTAPTAPTAPTVPAPPTEAGVPWGAVLAVVWIAVGAVLTARYALAYARTRRAVNRAVPLEREDARYATLPKCARLREGPMEGAPLTFGVLRPTVVLFPGLEGTELACVLAHEGVHARRRDNLWHYAAAAALTVFWWDPAVWLMARLIRRDVELSCDRAVVRRLGEGKRAEYANALVTLSTQAEGGAFCHGFGPKRTEERIIAVMKYKKTTIIGAALTLALVLAVTVGFASNPGEAKADPNTDADTQDTVISTPGLTAPDDALSNDLSVDSNEAEPELEFVYYDSNDPDSILKEYKTMLDRRVAQGKCTQAEADELLANMERLIERAKNGEIKGLMFNKQTGDEMLFVEAPELTSACTQEDCTVSAPHWHEGSELFYAYDEPYPQNGADAENRGEPHICLREDCPIQPSVHFHEADGSVTYVYSQPSKYSEPETDNQGNEIVCCGFEGCTIQGEHFHHDTKLEDSAGDGSKPIGCPPEAIDQDFYQKYPKASEQNFEHHESGHHQDSHH